MDINQILVILMFATFIGILLIGYPIPFALGGTAVLFVGVGYIADNYFGAFTGIDLNYFGLVITRIYKTMTNWVLVSLPIFIFMGLMLDKSGIAERLMNSSQKLFGKVRGGLAITVTFVGVLLAASTGIVGASVVLLGLLSLPAMLNQGYSKTLALGTVASAGTLGILIPPSIMLVVMGDQLSLSVGDLFLGAVFPGLILAGMYVVFILIFAFFSPKSAPLPKDLEPVSWKVVKDVILNVIPPFGLIVAVLGSIFAGIATVTEASAVGALGSLLLAVMFKKFNFEVLKDVLYGTFNTTAYIFGIFVGATAFALVLRGLGGDEVISEALTSLPFGPIGTILVILGVVFLLGFFLDWVEITLIVLPLLSPVIPHLGLNINGYGVLENPNLLWFVMLVAMTLQTSFLTPPVGFSLFYLKGVTPPNITLGDIYKGVIPFIIIQLLSLFFLIIFPELITWLPATIYK